MAAIVFGLARRARLPALVERHSSTLVLGLFAFVNGLIAIGAMALVALLTGEPTQAEEFLADTLGRLLHADRETQEVVRTYVREQCNTSRTAERLYTHRNTVLRRLARAEELLPRPLADDVVSVAAALEVLRWRGVAP
jgi:DNA-binding PucR family transcriptional regulator